MKSILFVTIFLIATTIYSQVEQDLVRYIEVTGSSEMEVEPDEIKFIIGIQEYWEEEFEKGKEFKDYKTKVPIDLIESNLLKDLKTVGIDKKQIIIKEVGNYWRYKGKEFLISKQFEITLYDFNKVNEITTVINTKGIDYMRIGELKNKDLTEYRKEVKINALKAAKEKAAYLLESLNKECGDIISIVEIDNDTPVWRPQAMTSNTIMASSDDSGVDNFKKIKLRYEIKAKFEIK